MTTPEELDARYGRTRRRRMPWVVGGVAAAVAVGALGWVIASDSMSTVQADDLGFDLIDEHSVEVRFQIAGVQGRDAACVIEALDEEFGVVGWKLVEIAAGDDHSRALSVSVPTVAAATTGLVNTCWLT